jgi:hypothetical protein
VKTVLANAEKIQRVVRRRGRNRLLDDYAALASIGGALFDD